MGVNFDKLVNKIELESLKMEFGKFGISCRFSAILWLCCIITKLYGIKCIKNLECKLDEY